MTIPLSFSRFRPLLILTLIVLPFCALSNGSLEELINERLADFPLTPDNKHRLAALSELKGDYSATSNSLTIDFGDIGKLEVYQHNFLLRLGNNRVYHLDRRRTHPRDVAIMNETLRSIFEQIALLANHDAHPDLIYFVDEHLAKKNLEPFEKLYLRHILIRFGRFDAARGQVEFHTDWLPVHEYQYEAPNEHGTILIRKPIDPILIKLDEATVRGYYLSAGGTVYVEDVTREVFYATGESYQPNVVAFKRFLQDLFTQTTHYVVQAEEERVEQIREERRQAVSVATANAYSRRPPAYSRGMGTSRSGDDDETSTAPVVKPLYTREDWMGRMIGLLRYQNSLTDPDVASFLVDQSFFPQLYGHLTIEEKAFYDQISRVR